MAYALVQNGQVVGTQGALPGCFENVTGFDTLTDAQAAAYGWLPIIDEPPAFDNSSQSLSGPTYVIGASSVTTAYTVNALTEEQIATNFANAQAAALAQLQNIKNGQLLSMSYTFDGATYRVTLSVQDQIDIQTRIQMLTAAAAGTTVNWEIVNNVFVTFALSDLQALYAAGLTYINAVYTNVASLVAQINAAATVTAVAAINLNAGWP